MWYITKASIYFMYNNNMMLWMMVVCVNELLGKDLLWQFLTKLTKIYSGKESKVCMIINK